MQIPDKDIAIRTLMLSFNFPLYNGQITQWRGAFIQMAGWKDELFHNHDNSKQSPSNNKYHYRYPLVQYRTFKGKAAIFAINEGVVALQKVLHEKQWEIVWGGKNKSLQVEDLRMNTHYLRMTKDNKKYKLYNWLALNEQGERIEVTIEFPNRRFPVNYHGIKLMAFDIEFTTNVLLPNRIAIGKGVSHGFGWIVPQRTKYPLASIQNSA